MSKWISINDSLPNNSEYVWCHRYFVRDNGSVFSEVIEAIRRSNSQLTIDEDFSKNCWWYNTSGGSFSDSTVSHWMYKQKPEPPKD